MELEAPKEFVDIRTLCGLKGCEQKAFSLMAWPRRNPVPLCKSCRDRVLETVEQMKKRLMARFSEGDWVKWLNNNAKEHIVRG